MLAEPPGDYMTTKAARRSPTTENAPRRLARIAGKLLETHTPTLEQCEELDQARKAVDQRAAMEQLAGGLERLLRESDARLEARIAALEARTA